MATQCATKPSSKHSYKQLFQQDFIAALRKRVLSVRLHNLISITFRGWHGETIRSKRKMMLLRKLLKSKKRNLRALSLLSWHHRTNENRMREEREQHYREELMSKRKFLRSVFETADKRGRTVVLRAFHRWNFVIERSLRVVHVESLSSKIFDL